MTVGALVAVGFVTWLVIVAVVAVAVLLAVLVALWSMLPVWDVAHDDAADGHELP